MFIQTMPIRSNYVQYGKGHVQYGKGLLSLPEHYAHGKQPTFGGKKICIPPSQTNFSYWEGPSPQFSYPSSCSANCVFQNYRQPGYVGPARELVKAKPNYRGSGIELASEVNRLQLENANLTNKNANLTNKNEILIKENLELQRRNANLLSKNGSLLYKNKELWNAKDRLVEENARLKSQQFLLSQGNRALHKRNEELSTKFMESQSQEQSKETVTISPATAEKISPSDACAEKLCQITNIIENQTIPLAIKQFRIKAILGIFNTSGKISKFYGEDILESAESLNRSHGNVPQVPQNVKNVADLRLPPVLPIPLQYPQATYPLSPGGISYPTPPFPLDEFDNFTLSKSVANDEFCQLADFFRKFDIVSSLT